jgi:hypothetical protein
MSTSTPQLIDYQPFMGVMAQLKDWYESVVWNCYNRFMKKIIVILLLLLVPSLALAQPVIKFDEDSHDFGVVNGKTSLDHTFEVMNAGTETLVINKISPP